MKIKIGIIGKAGRSKELPEFLIKNAKIIGKEVAKNGCILITGGCMGVAQIAAEAAIKEKGIVLSYSPAKNLKEHLEPPISYPKPIAGEIPIFTGFGKIGRNILSILESDGVIIVGGGIGTLNEFSIAYIEDKIIGVLEGGGGIVEKILESEKDLKIGTAKEFKGVIIRERDPKKLVRKVIKEIKRRQEKPRQEIPMTFKNKRGRELMGILHLPEREKPPLAVICHGFQRTKTERKFVFLARELSKEGIAVFRFDFEGCGDSDGDAKEITFSNEVEDLKTAINFVLGNSNLDSKRLAIIADSSGSVVATLFAQNHPLKTLCFWNPALNQRKLLKKWYDKEEIAALLKKGVIIKGKREIGKRYFLENRNKDYTNLISKLSIPILIVHGKEDEEVPIEESQKIAKKYKNVILKEIPGADHKFEKIIHQEKAIQITKGWLKKYL
jgi:uncharacterized protein (TIGR00725 family)